MKIYIRGFGVLGFGDASVLPDWQALEMATLNGARALGLEAQIGSLEPGKQADLIAVDLRAPEQQPLFDPLSQLVHTQVGHCVSHSWVAGEPVLVAGQPTRLNLASLVSRAEEWRQQIASAGVLSHE